MNENFSSVSFTSNIRFIPFSRYEKIAKEPDATRVSEMWNLNHVREIENKAKGATDGIIYCVAGIIKNVEKTTGQKVDFLFHWFPKPMFEGDRFYCSGQHSELKEAIKNAAKSKDSKGFLIGGISKDAPYSNSLSLRLINFLKHPFKKEHRNHFTMFFSQDCKDADIYHRPKSAFVYDKKTDTYYVNCQKDVKGKFRDLMNKDKIKQHFDYIHISPEDKVFIGREQVPREFFNKRNT